MTTTLLIKDMNSTYRITVEIAIEIGDVMVTECGDIPLEFVTLLTINIPFQ